MSNEDETAEEIVGLFFGDHIDTMSAPAREDALDMAREMVQRQHIIDVQQRDRRSRERARDLSDTEQRAAKARDDELRLQRVLRLFVLVHSLGRDLAINDVAFAEDLHRDVAGELVRRRFRKGDLMRAGKVSGRGSANVFKPSPRLLRELGSQARSNQLGAPRPSDSELCRIGASRKSRSRGR